MREAVRDIIDQIIGTLAPLRVTFGIWDAVDILIIAFLIYRTLNFMQKTNASSVIKGLLFILGLAWLANFFNMNILSYLLRQVVQMGLIVVVILFQPEIRKLFERMGTTRLGNIFRKRGKYEKLEDSIKKVVAASIAMAKTQTGAIIVIERNVGLNDFVGTGVEINANVSSELIQNIFYDNSPLHDGALILREDKLLAAACMLPLSTNYALGKELGMRHRAGIGLSERSDAVIVIVSEQTGAISVAIDGMLKRSLNSETLEKLLKAEIISADDKDKRKRKQKEEVNV
ncbi:MAG: diadenylate cyclase CdaA [Oscillospiraceae bacterium]|nr:diadenylate cyclase CdaA [Oscillospiraceae bacterium]MCL2278329.1 diadenylate cyclase CdaA [Oscillospiraceae bacterium]